jgi:peptide/nickel transport system substrate-binding protein
MKQQRWFFLLVVLALLTACAPAGPVASEGGTGAASAPATSAPTVGGTLTLVNSQEPDSLDSQVGGGGDFGYGIIYLLNSTLVHLDVESANYVPYLAESWTTSEDGLTWEFKLKQGVKFHDGSDFTAEDYVYTIERAQNPDTGARIASFMFAPVSKAEAVDEYTLKLTLDKPYPSFLYSLSTAFTAPHAKEAVEKAGADYGKQPVGVGPYQFVSWTTGDKVVLQRNADFNWAPPFAHQGAPYIETIEFRIISEPATVLAGLEAGEIDAANVEAKDAQRLQESGNYQLFQGLGTGIPSYLALNNSVAPFNDLKVRQAVSMAIDKDALVKLVLQGNGQPQAGPLSPRDLGYWAGVEEIAYKFDLAKAQALMSEAGYADSDGDGIVEKDGQPLKLTVKLSNEPANVRTAEVLKEQLKPLGIDLTIEQLEFGQWIDALYTTHDYTISVAGIGYGEYDLMYSMFHSAGDSNVIQLQDAETDQLLEGMRVTDDAARQQAIEAAQKRIVEQAYLVPLYTDYASHVVNNRVQGVRFGSIGDPRFGLVWFDAYIAQ